MCVCFREASCSQRKMWRPSLYPPSLHPSVGSPLFTLAPSHHCGTFITQDERTLTQHHPKATVYIQVRAVFCGLQLKSSTWVWCYSQKSVYAAQKATVPAAPPSSNPCLHSLRSPGCYRMEMQCVTFQISLFVFPIVFSRFLGLIGWFCCCCWFFSFWQSCYVAVGGLELTVQTRIVLNLECSFCLCSSVILAPNILLWSGCSMVSSSFTVEWLFNGVPHRASDIVATSLGWETFKFIKSK